MDTNLCRDLVRYIPVWNPDWEDEVPALVSEEEFLASLMGSVSKITYDDPYVWNSLTVISVQPPSDVRPTPGHHPPPSGTSGTSGTAGAPVIDRSLRTSVYHRVFTQ
ncbi:hypothetical protein B0H11DRAFT_2220103 [Mycena galericulata]|nr:hypothetical protein B0H11DRAFT_2220103 [Mycena galericulata]